MSDFLFRGSLADLDPAIFELGQIEAERQFRKLILIPSESTAPLAVREALSSAFQNIYAEKISIHVVSNEFFSIIRSLSLRCVNAYAYMSCLNLNKEGTPEGFLAFLMLFI